MSSTVSGECPYLRTVTNRARLRVDALLPWCLKADGTAEVCQAEGPLVATEMRKVSRLFPRRRHDIGILTCEDLCALVL